MTVASAATLTRSIRSPSVVVRSPRYCEPLAPTDQSGGERSPDDESPRPGRPRALEPRRVALRRLLPDAHRPGGRGAVGVGAAARRHLDRVRAALQAMPALRAARQHDGGHAVAAD